MRKGTVYTHDTGLAHLVARGYKLQWGSGGGQKKVGEVQAGWFWPALGIGGALAVGIPRPVLGPGPLCSKQPEGVGSTGRGRAAPRPPSRLSVPGGTRVVLGPRRNHRGEAPSLGIQESRATSPRIPVKAGASFQCLPCHPGLFSG